VDSGGAIRVVAQENGSDELAHLRRDADGWAQEVLRANPVGVVATLDPQEELAYCWQDDGATVDSVTASCERKVAGGWSTKSVLLNERQHNFTLRGLAFDSLGRMHLAAMRDKPDGECCAVSHWVEDGAGWQVTDLARIDGFASTLSLSEVALDSKGTAHFAVGNNMHFFHIAHGP